MQWDFIQPSLPPRAHTGRPRADGRMTINGILYVLMSGCRWMDTPSRYGSWKTVWERHKKWSEKGVWKKIMDLLVSHGYSNGSIHIDDDLSVDSSTVTAKKGGSRTLAMMVTRKRKEAKYICSSNTFIFTNSTRPWTWQ